MSAHEKGDTADTASPSISCRSAAAVRDVFSKDMHHADSMALKKRNEGCFLAGLSRNRRSGKSMPNRKAPTQETFRSSDSGRFVTERFATRNPKTTERERIKHPERK
jgi:hypothetical protein